MSQFNYMIQTYTNFKRTSDYHANILPSTGQENNIAEPKTGKWLSSPSRDRWMPRIFGKNERINKRMNE